MAELRPYPFGALVTRALRELDARDSVFDLPRKKFFLGDATRDLSVRFHGLRASTALGPAAGPQSQMAQNIVLSWLGGARILELKTVQINDELVIPRPCIDMQTVGYNVEWSQELKLEQSLDEYVKGAMLVRILQASGAVEVVPGYADTLYDMSVGYDLKGIQSERVQAFLEGMLDCSDVLERLRGELTGDLARFRDLDYQTRLATTLTLSTFHGCPPDEIERIIAFLLEKNGLHCVVKLNPTLLGPAATRELLCERMGYDELVCPASAFELDTKWEQAEGFVERLGARADELGLGFGVKFSNTLIVLNHRGFFPKAEKVMYLSGLPLHVLAMTLVQRFRARFGARYPISFAAGIDRKNFPDAVALGLVPITVCSDLLKPGGYARSHGYFEELAGRMDAVGATSVGEWCLRAYGQAGGALTRISLAPARRAACERALAGRGDLRAAAGDEAFARWVAETALANTEVYVPRASADARYSRAGTDRPPRKLGSSLALFDCVTCDKCVPVCPNDANFTFVLPRLRTPIVKVRRADGRWTSRTDGELAIEQKHQIANFADFCNECGNCDIFCPEDGGPYVVKPRFFGRLADWRELAHLDGFHLSRKGDESTLHGRIDGREYALVTRGARASYAGLGFELAFDEGDPLATLTGSAAGEVDLSYWRILAWVRDAVYATGELSYPSVLAAASAERP